MDLENKSFGKHIHEARAKKGHTQQVLANEAEIGLIQHNLKY